jgi:hypothetical protein
VVSAGRIQNGAQNVTEKDVVRNLNQTLIIEERGQVLMFEFNHEN